MSVQAAAAGCLHKLTFQGAIDTCTATGATIYQVPLGSEISLIRCPSVPWSM
jgi:hypothetical protein